MHSLFLNIRRGLIALAGAMLVLCASGTLYQMVAMRGDQRAFPAPGQLVDVGGYKLHISCLGTPHAGSPTVILEGAHQATSSLWALVQSPVAAEARVCAYDRAGLGWSEPGPEPRDAEHVSRELHTLLANAGIPAPYVLVGHSYGGLYARVYAAQYPTEVAGLVLVDATHPDVWTRTPAGRAEYQATARRSRMAPIVAGLGLIRLLDLFPLHADLPPQQEAQYTAFKNSTAFWSVSDAEYRATPATVTQARSAGSLGRLPLTVVSAGQHVRDDPLWSQLQDELATLSTNGIHSVVDGADHFSLLLKQQDARMTAAAILRTVKAVRTGQPLRP
jgi:pimeloyl-ACP methyl ester carboxylesterase